MSAISSLLRRSASRYRPVSTGWSGGSAGAAWLGSAVSAIGHHPVDNVVRPKTNPRLRSSLALLAARDGLQRIVVDVRRRRRSEPAAASGPSVEFLGPERLTRPAELEARARPASGSRVVAVTFFLDGRPLGSDTTRPYRLDVDPALLPPGDHRCAWRPSTTWAGAARRRRAR